MSRDDQAPRDRFRLLRRRAEALIEATAERVHDTPATEIQRLVYELEVHRVELEMQNEELRSMQMELVEARDRLLELYDFAPVGYLTLGEKGKIRDANITSAKLLDEERGSLIGRSFAEFVVPADQERYHFHRRSVMGSHLPQSCELSLASSSRAPSRCVELRSVVARSAESRDGDVRVALFDVTERKRAEAERERLASELVHARKMEAVGQLAGGVAHDFNNMLTVVQGHVEMLKMAFSTRDDLDVGEIAAGLDEIDQACARGADLVRQLLTFSRKQPVKTATIDVARVIDRLDTMLHRLLSENIELDVHGAPSLWPIEADPTQIEQVVVNLVLNARDALPRGGRITVRAANANIDDLSEIAGSLSRTASFVLIEVEDDGVGMDESTRSHATEPFFTTKPFGQGTGLGLATVHGIVRRAQGHLEISSTVGRGTTVRVWWPRAQTQPDAVEQDGENARPESLVGGETILVCEDDEAVRGLVRAILESAGYEVLVAADPEEAIRIADEHDGAIRMLVSDIIMPKMNGRVLASRLARTRPGLSVLLVSGYEPDVLTRSRVDDGFDYLPKPFSSAQLLRRVRAVLDGEDPKREPPPDRPSGSE